MSTVEQPTRDDTLPTTIPEGNLKFLKEIKYVGKENPTGENFSFNDFNGIANGATLQQISVWPGKEKIRAIKVWLTDGRSMQFGEPDKKIKTKEFTFGDGEHFTSLSLMNTKDVTHLSGIKFKTNMSQMFSARTEKINEEFSIDVASGICIGVKVCVDKDKKIVNLGFMFIENIKSAKLTDVSYPTLYEVVPKVAVKELKSMTYQNNSASTQEYTIETSTKVTKSSSWSITGRLEYTFSMDVKAGIPCAVETNFRHELKIGIEDTSASSTTEEKMEQFSFPIKVPAHTTVDVDITLGQATFSLPFQGNVMITCCNGGVLKFNTTGIYKGLTNTDCKIVVNEKTI